MTSQEEEVALDNAKKIVSDTANTENAGSDVAAPPEVASALSSELTAPEPTPIPKTEEAGDRFLRRWQIR